MNVTNQLAKNLRDVFSSGNWTAVSLKDQLIDVTWEQATKKVHEFHTIAELVYHVNYFVDAVIPVLQGGTLDAHDKFSFDVPAIESAEDWQKLQNKTWSDADQLASLIEQLPEEKLWETFVDEKYGNYYRNFFGIIEHTHYHLGQIALIKKLIHQDGLFGDVAID